jgi:hypothetical protein
MGCDIHCYVEFKEKDSTHWHAFGGRINPGRYYGIFTLMAGVRGNESEAMFQPRGLPSDVASEARGDNQLFISVVKETNYVTPEQAEKWVESGSSKYVYANLSDDNKPAWVTHPNWHSHSWLTADEFSKVIEKAQKNCACVRYAAILAAMRTFEKAGYESRLVFWFDN